MDFIIDEQGNYFLKIETRADFANIMGTELVVPNTFFNDYMIVAKLAPNLELIWH